ncbi:hypothetical protein TNCV_937831 [Trichonephila clavipes]|nr:hypothetical protein TNCV_937831 [Trichonephila clavipes]
MATGSSLTHNYSRSQNHQQEEPMDWEDSSFHPEVSQCTFYSYPSTTEDEVHHLRSGLSKGGQPQNALAIHRSVDHDRPYGLKVWSDT